MRGVIFLQVHQIKKVACLGAGVIGAGWATSFALRGYAVSLYRRNAAAFAETKKAISGNLDFLAGKELLAKEEAERAGQRITCTTSIEEAVRGARYIQESSPETYEAKRELLAETEKFAAPEAIFASSSSGLLITEIARSAGHPERCIGAHPYNPVYLIPLVEITRGEKTSPAAVTCTYDFMLKLGKEPVVLNKETLGFIANRLQLALSREIMDLVMRGVCSVEDVDKALVFGPGIRLAILGQVLNMHLAGGKGGARQLYKNLHRSASLWLEDMAGWTAIPEEWPDVAHEGVLRELENRPAEFGKTPAEIARFRDNMLVEILKLHKKI